MNESDLHQLVSGDKAVTLIGTAHVSRESADLVAETIQRVRPDTVCVELCQSRYQALRDRGKWQDTNLFTVLREKKASLLLMNMVLAYFQKKIGKKLGVKPGEEMIRAIQAAEAVGAGIHLADRDVRVTLSRAWRSIRLWTKIKLLFQLIVSFGEVDSLKQEDIEEMKKKDVLEALLSEIGESLPDVRQYLIEERDQYLAYNIRNAPGDRIVAVVGAGHVPGIKRYWDKAIHLEDLDQIPKKRKASSYLKWGVPVIILALIISGFFFAGAGSGKSMVKYWVIANGVLAGLGAAAALAHPLTILAAIVASPLTSLNPMIAAGWVAGVVEVIVGKPKVRDFEMLPEDISSLKGFWRNKVTRVLMVVVFTNLGSALGAFVAIPFMLKVLA
ncbi:MAG: TraB/GumN family protein [Deltaproteobacteria bacterium]|nr:TraB/GumN family protein [Deltaproteobacteria bacterium]